MVPVDGKGGKYSVSLLYNFVNLLNPPTLRAIALLC
jgi:hypothetical protein